MSHWLHWFGFSSVWVLIYLQHQQISYHSSCTDMVYLQCVSPDDLCKPYSGRMYCHRECMNMVFPTRETSYSLKDHHYEESLVTMASWIWFLSRVFSHDLYKPYFARKPCHNGYKDIFLQVCALLSFTRLPFCKIILSE